MLTIRAAQWSQFGREAREQFAGALARHLAATYPREFPAAPDAAPSARESIERCRKFGITLRGDVTRMAEWFVEFGADFARAPGRQRIERWLEHPALPGSAKVTAIQQHLEQCTDGRKLVQFRP